MSENSHYPIAVLLVGAGIIAAIVYSYEHRLNPNSKGFAISDILTNKDKEIPVGNMLNVKVDPSLNLQGVGVTDTHGRAASVLNPAIINIGDGGNSEFINNYIRYVQGLSGNLKNLLDLGLGNANVDQTQFVGINYSHINPSPTIFSSN